MRPSTRVLEAPTTFCGEHGTPTWPNYPGTSHARCSACDEVMPYWHELVAQPVQATGHAWDLRVDTGDFRVWTSRMSIADGEPYERTVYVETYHDHGWLDLGHYDGDDPPRGLPGVTRHALRGELALREPAREQAWVAADVPGVDGELLVRLEPDGSLNVCTRPESWMSWGPPVDAERRH